MEILKAANDWGKAEIFSAQIFMLFGVLFLIASIGFWQLGRTEVARAFISPTMIAGIFLLLTGIGFVFSNKSRISNFETAYKKDTAAFVKSEIARAEQTMSSYEMIAFKVFPAIIVVAALLLIFMNTPTWRASCIAVIATMLTVIAIDYNAHARMEVYHQQLASTEN